MSAPLPRQKLAAFANLLQGANVRALVAYIIAAALYLGLAIALRQLLRWAGPRFIFGG